MTVKFGQHTLAIKTPADIDAALIETTGCTGAEIRAQLERGAYPAHLARALHPFLADPKPLADLSQDIASDDVDLADLRSQVIALYPSSVEKPAAPAAKGKAE